MYTSQKKQLFSNLAEAKDGVAGRIKARQLVHSYRADPAYGRGVAEKLGMDMSAFSAWANIAARAFRVHQRRRLRSFIFF
jgi:catalase